MNICFSVGNLELGGAQMFVTRLAALLSENAAHKIFIYDHLPELRDRNLAKTVPHGVKIFSYSESGLFRWLTWKLNGFLLRLKLHGEYRNALNKKRFRKFLEKNNIHIVNSHSSHSDFVCADIELPGRCQLLITLHGEYELILGEPTHKVDFEKLIRQALGKSAALIYTAGKNLETIEKFGYPHPVFKIPVGISRKALPRQRVTRSSLGIRESDFVAGMVGRGIPEKGWSEAIAAVQSCNASGENKIKLVLIGNSEYLRKLVDEKKDPSLILLTFESGILEYYSYYSLFDVFLFPSSFAGESVPNVIIESLSWNVPVLASRHAEIPSMIEEETGHPAGICVAPGDTLQGELVANLTELRVNHSLRKRLSDNCPRAFAKFDLEKIAEEYLKVFRSVLDKNATT